MDNSQSPPLDMASFNTQNTMDSTPDFSSFLDYNQLNSPAGATPKTLMVPQTTSTLTSPTSAISRDMTEDQMLMPPSHDYARFKQQTGLPVQANVHALGQFSGFNTGLYESQMWEGMPTQSAIDPNFEAFLEMSANEDYIDPNAIMKQEEVQANIRYFPGMHQQAAMQRQAIMAKQKQQREAEQQRRQQAAHATSSRRTGSSQPLDSRTEETISRVMSQIRRSSNLAADSVSPPPGSVLPHIIKAKKDEDDMDEDERLLNSEEGKKLTSKERRQLRNKVSARAFRSRRKEYIGQLEGELAAKANEAAEFKHQNQMLMEENARFRSLAEKLLSHNAFRPFLEELSRDPELADSLSKVAGTPMSAQRTAQQIPKDIDFGSSQQFIPPPNANTHVGMTMIPEMPVDLSSLNIGSTWNAPHHGMSNFQQPSVFAVTELPQGPAEPIDFDALSGKDSDNVLSELAGFEEKPSYPEIEALPCKTESTVQAREFQTVEEPEHELDENDESITLFATSRSSRSTTVEEMPESENLFGSIASEKVLGHFELVIRSENQNQNLDDELSRMTARLEASCRKVEKLMSRF